MGRAWDRLSPLRRVVLILLGVVLLGCGGLSGLGALAALVETPSTEKAADARPVAAAPEGTVVAPSTTTPTAPPSTAVAQGASPSPVTSVSAVVEKRMVRETRRISFKTRTVKDSALPEGTKEVRVRGVAGVRTLTYQVTLTDGAQTGKRLISSVVTKKPVTKVVAIGTMSEPDCDPNYSGECVPIDSDVDCGGGSGNGPSYVYGVVKVVGTDIYDLDRDNDGYGCD
jgi:hypothetical protein